MSGKSNLLEAVYFLSLGKLLRAQYDREVVRFGENFSKVNGLVNRNSESLELEVTVDLSNCAGNRSDKSFQVNRIRRGQANFTGRLAAVEFCPEDINLVLATPGLRRRYLNTVYAQCDRNYRRCLMRYQRLLINRNHLLKSLRESGGDLGALQYWDASLVENGSYLTEKRRDFFDFTRDIICSLGHTVNSNNGDLRLSYKSSDISQDRLMQYREKELAAGTTLVGPHRDDFTFFWGDLELAAFGSRGQQRTAVFILKMAEAKFIEKKVGDSPVFLLDDIFSELDDFHRRQVLQVLDDQQVLLTTADEGLVEEAFAKKVEVLRL